MQKSSKRGLGLALFWVSKWTARRRPQGGYYIDPGGQGGLNMDAFFEKLGNPEPRGIKIQKKHKFSYIEKSIFVTITEAIWTPDITALACFSAIAEATQAP